MKASFKGKALLTAVLLSIILYSLSVIGYTSTNPFPHKGDLVLPVGTTTITENTVTGVEEGDLYIPPGAILHLGSNSTFIWNPGYSIHIDGEITFDPGAQLRQGYLCVSVDETHSSWHDPTFSAELPCPSEHVRWKDVWDLPSCSDEPVYFPDPNLEQAIREAINKPTGDIYESDLVGLTVLAAYNEGIVNLEGIQHCVDLTMLGLWENQIVDISPLSGLTNLTWLSLCDNQIVDISPLSGLTNLTTLYLWDNQISDIAPLAGLINLTELDLWDNQISDISALSGLTNLTSLPLWDNQIVDISPLSGLTNLRSLNLESNQIVDISPLSGLTNLRSLNLESNQIVDISPLSGLTNLRSLNLFMNQIVDISALAGLTDLGELDLSRNLITNVAPLLSNAGINHGDRVDISYNHLCLFPGSEDLANIEELLYRGVRVIYRHQTCLPDCDVLHHDLPQQGWHMITLPGDLCPSCEPWGGGEGGDLICALSDNLDPCYIFHYDPIIGGYVMTPPAGNIPYHAGMGFWVRTYEENVTVDAEVKVPTEAVGIPLSNGWNQIGNPFTFAVPANALKVRCGDTELSLTDAQAQGWVSAYLFGYDTGSAGYLMIDPTSGCLQPWNGYWMRSYRNDCVLIIPPTECSSSSSTNEALCTKELQARGFDAPPPPPTNLMDIDVRKVLANLTVCNIPNPIRSEHTSTFKVEGKGSELVQAIRVEIYNQAGQKVFTQNVNAKELEWHTMNDAGELLANGVYLYQVWVEIGGEWYPTAVHKLAVVR